MNIENLPGIGKNKWIRYHFDGSPLRINPRSNIDVILTEQTTSVVPFSQARKNVAEDIYELAKSKGLRLFVAMSGGCDSECVAQSFYDLKIPFTPVISDFYIDGRLPINHEDTWWAKRWCKINGITPHIISSKNFSETIIANAEICERIKARQPAPMHSAGVAENIKNLDGALVGGMGFFEYYPDYTLDYMYDSYYDPKSALEKPAHGWIMHESDFHIDMNDPGFHPYNFLSWTPEIVAAYVFERDMNESSEENKFRIMNCLPRPKIGQMPMVHQFLYEYARSLRRRFGTVEAAWLGSHETFKEKLLRS